MHGSVTAADAHLDTSMRNAGKTACSIISGFLGAGKTSLVGHLLKQADGDRLAAIIDDFGNVDVRLEPLFGAAVQKSGGADVTELSNGCLFCTTAGDLVAALRSLLACHPRPRHILIETSGTALPTSALSALRTADIVRETYLNGIVVVVDGLSLSLDGHAAPTAIAQQRVGAMASAGDLFLQQLRSADLAVLNKIDLITKRDRADVTNTIMDVVARGVPIIETFGGQITPSAFLDMRAPRDWNSLGEYEPSSDSAFDRIDVALPHFPTRKILLERLAEAVWSQPILRMKGFATVGQVPRRVCVQGVGRRIRCHDTFGQPKETAESSRLVVIGAKGIDSTAVRNLVEAEMRVLIPMEAQP